VKRRPAYQQFAPLPSNETIFIAWPTPNRALFDAPQKFFAHTRVNPDYGKPGWTRDCGKRFHRGCDIAPVNVMATGATTKVIFTDCATGKDFESIEPAFVPHDEVFCAIDGVLAELVDDENASDFGKHIVIEHRWPGSGEKFFTVYAHLDQIFVGGDFIRDDSELQIETRHTPIRSGQLIAEMGQTSRSADARNWLAIAPHLHIETRNAAGEPYDPVEFLSRFLPRRQRADSI
jgi:murein DD-endopeptidase MepM/ murein hydrolase activator NlpD